MNWDLPKQTFLVENGQVGDCWRCCIAAVLQVPAEKVPHFLQEAKVQREDPDMLTQKWLNDRGYLLIEANRVYFHYLYGRNVEPVPVIACGPNGAFAGNGKTSCSG